MGEAPEGGFDAAQDDRDAGEKRPDLVGVDQDGPVGHGGTIGRVLVLLPSSLEGRVIDEQAVDGAGRHAEI
jgi:hypothetical protein